MKHLTPKFPRLLAIKKYHKQKWDQTSTIAEKNIPTLLKRKRLFDYAPPFHLETTTLVNKPQPRFELGTC
jgi:hypothetical protein